MFETYRTKYTEPNEPNQIYSIKPANLIYLTNSTKLNLEKLNLQKIELKSNPSLYWAWPSLFDLSVTALWYMVQGENVKI